MKSKDWACSFTVLKKMCLQGRVIAQLFLEEPLLQKEKKNILQWFLSTVSYAFQFSQQRSFGTIKANIDSAFLQGQQTTALNFDKHGHYEQAFGSISVLKKLKHTAATISIKLFTMINIQ